MTRKEQIIAKASKDSENFYKVNDNYGHCFHGGFIDGAEWADEHPKQGLINIEKACKWLDDNFMNLIWGRTRSVYAGGNFATVDEMIANFRKAMEE